MKDLWLNGIMGAVVGDALGVPYEFKKRGTFECIGMKEYGTHGMPKGTWSDDSSMIFATMDSIADNGKIVADDIMERFTRWLDNAEYCAFDKVFDCGITVKEAIREGKAPSDEMSNGNGSLMRILPVCLFAVEHNIHPIRVKKLIHEVAGLTHGHVRSKVACGLYYTFVFEILNKELGTKSDLYDRLQRGIDMGQILYKRSDELQYYSRMFDMDAFKELPESEIRSSGYVVDSLEAAVWCLLNTESYEECMKKAVNLGEDTDTVACIAGGLAGLYYGYDSIPKEWIDEIKRLDYVKEMIERM